MRTRRRRRRRCSLYIEPRRRAVRDLRRGAGGGVDRFAIFDDDAGGVADEAAAGSVRVFDDEAAAPAALAARFDAEARPTPVIFEDAPAAPKPDDAGGLPHLRGQR